MLKSKQRRQCLIDYEVKFGQKTQAAWLEVDNNYIQTAKDIFKANAAYIAEKPENINFDALDALSDGGKVVVRWNKDTEEYFCLFTVLAYLPDSDDFVGPMNGHCNNTTLKTPPNTLVGFIYLQYMGEIDPPLHGPYVHTERMTVEFKGHKCASGDVPGVKICLRGSHVNEDKSRGLQLTNTVTGKDCSVSLWSCIYAMTAHYPTLFVKGAKVYITPSQRTIPGQTNLTLKH